jgi:hypothetical protein
MLSNLAVNRSCRQFTVFLRAYAAFAVDDRQMMSLLELETEPGAQRLVDNHQRCHTSKVPPLQDNFSGF